jgi:conjugal transfer pilus assembly protein TraF
MFCRTQYAVLSVYSDRHGWPVKTIDIDKNPAAAARFNITTVPVTVVVKKGSDQWMPVAVGQEALTTIETNVYRAIRFLRGDTSPSQFLQMAHEDGSVSDPDRTFEDGL